MSSNHSNNSEAKPQHFFLRSCSHNNIQGDHYPPKVWNQASFGCTQEQYVLALLFVQLTQGHTLDSCNLSIVRDNWDPVKPEVESKISAILGTAWVIDFDTGLAWEQGQDGDSRYAKENPGKMLAE